MEDLEKQVKDVCNQFFRDTVGNRLNQWSWTSFQNTVLKMVKDYKVKNDKTK